MGLGEALEYARYVQDGSGAGVGVHHGRPKRRLVLRVLQGYGLSRETVPNGEPRFSREICDEYAYDVLSVAGPPIGHSHYLLLGLIVVSSIGPRSRTITTHSPVCATVHQEGLGSRREEQTSFSPKLIECIFLLQARSALLQKSSLPNSVAISFNVEDPRCGRTHHHMMM